MLFITPLRSYIAFSKHGYVWNPIKKGSAIVTSRRTLFWYCLEPFFLRVQLTRDICESREICESGTGCTACLFCGSQIAGNTAPICDPHVLPHVRNVNACYAHQLIKFENLYFSTFLTWHESTTILKTLHLFPLCNPQ